MPLSVSTLSTSDRHGLVISLAEIMDLDIDRGRRGFGCRCGLLRRLLLVGGGVAEERKQEQQRRCGAPDASACFRRRERTATHGALSVHS
jgi:hypothetical protein